MPTHPITLINVLKVTAGTQDDLVALLKRNIETVVSTLAGWRKTRLIAAGDGNSVVIYSEWETPAAVEAMRADPRMQAYFPQISALASIDSTVGAEVFQQAR